MLSRSRNAFGYLNGPRWQRFLSNGTLWNRRSTDEEFYNYIQKGNVRIDEKKEEPRPELLKKVVSPVHPQLRISFCG